MIFPLPVSQSSPLPLITEISESMARSNISPHHRSSASQRAPIRSDVVAAKHSQPQQHSVPVWLKSLLTIQQGSFAVFCSLLGLSAIVYGYTVYTQDLWRSQHGQLRRLQIQERQQGVMNENLKHLMAQAAEQPNSGLVAPNPERIVTIPSAPPRPAKSAATPSVVKPIPKSKLSLGY
jgi:hypothetical protein